MNRSARPSISRREWQFVGIFVVGLLLLTSLPYLYGYLSSPLDRQFMGLMLDVPDHGQYLSWWRAFQSAPLIRNSLTPEPNEPIFFNLLWWTLAQVSRWTGLGYAPVYQAFRWVAGGAFLWAAYRLIARFLPDTRQRRTAFLLVALSSGLGWLLVVLKYTLTGGELLFPLDVYIAEGNSFLCILGYPHFALAAALILLTLEATWRGWKEKRLQHMVVAGLLGLLLSWQHAYDLLIVYGVLGAFALLVWWRRQAFPWQLFWGGVIVCVLSCSGAVYSVILTTIDPLWEEVLAQFANAGVYTPAPPHMLILFGFPLPLAVATWLRLVWKRQWNDENLNVMGWFLVGAALLYVPTDFQIHMLNSWQVPMMILATKGLYDWIAPAIANWRHVQVERVSRWTALILLLAVLPTNLYLWAWRLVDLGRHNYPYYLYRDEVEALDWLRENSTPEDIVLSSLTVGQYIPALSGNTAFLAHWAQTVDFYDKQERVSCFFAAATTDEERLETVRTFGVDYIFSSPAERELGNHDPASTPWLTRVYSNSQVSIYRVTNDLPPPVGSGDSP